MVRQFLRSSAPGRSGAIGLQARDLDSHADGSDPIAGRRDGAGLIDVAEQTAFRRAFVVHIEPKNRRASGGRDAQARLAEAIGLAAAIGLNVTGEFLVPLVQPSPAKLMGSGKVEEIAAQARLLEPEVVVVNAQLTPVQQRNLEKQWCTKVLDRTALILEIFGERAQTREGRLQVELAHLTWQRSRLVRSWTHLERQRGGFGFLGGPGETQIESDRRMIGERIIRIKKDLEDVKRTRGLHRRARRRVPFPVVALVGYTNAGKSTLFNGLTKAEVLAKDLLFATLDPTMRSIRLPSGRQIILSDTVGFIADLPTELVAAFRATLEEVLEADVIVHIRDSAHLESNAQKQDVLKVLTELGVDQAQAKVIEVLNKIDLLEPNIHASLLEQNHTDNAIAVSAITGAGVNDLLSQIDDLLNQEQQVFMLKLPASDGESLAWVYRHGQVTGREEFEGEITLNIAIDPQDIDHFKMRFMNLKQLHNT